MGWLATLRKANRINDKSFRQSAVPSQLQLVTIAVTTGGVV